MKPIQVLPIEMEMGVLPEKMQLVNFKCILPNISNIEYLSP